MEKSDQTQPNRSQSTYQAILLAIRNGVYRPGDRLREEEVAQRLGVSRTPVREALGRLLEKGLIEVASSRGLAVSVLSMPKVFELYAMRRELEGLVARFAAQHATDVEIENFEQLNHEFTATDDPRVAAELNRILHERFADACGNRYLRTAVKELQANTLLLVQTTFEAPGRVQTASAEHARIIDAIKQRDEEAAQVAAADHIARALKTRLRIAKENSPAI
ncbi:GntR family transcriptional regulator [Puniceibacterium sp. IMCC21224]|uniref:GntR family transcriptional regulator n=1 Tax=Puniceibacterium sp. IMCC21224 TaxID=1618204 RepID=UPI00064DBBD0|nr:GntR family transcriptional regulator [Puniceibacterium sp. IMCC21224]KMK65546.1 transcriptional regulator, GntR family [Puniceibacterium sp. IMCC21224]